MTGNASCWYRHAENDHGLHGLFCFVSQGLPQVIRVFCFLVQIFWIQTKTLIDDEEKSYENDNPPARPNLLRYWIMKERTFGRTNWGRQRLDTSTVRDYTSCWTASRDGAATAASRMTATTTPGAGKPTAAHSKISEGGLDEDILKSCH